MKTAIHVNYEYSDNIAIIHKWFDSIDYMFAADFETASRYTKKEKEVFAYRITNRKLSEEEERTTLQKYLSNGISHPSLTVITHLSIATSEDDAKVIVCSNNEVRKAVFNFLTSTDKLQLWHNCAFDFKHIYYNTHKFPKNYLDTLQLCRCLLNDADGAKNLVGLKHLMGYAYGSWAISKDSFELEEMWDENMLKYAATDAAATFKLYQSIVEEVGDVSFC